MRLGTLRLASLAVAAALASAPALGADDYPSKAVTHVVPTAPGGGQDTLARILSTKVEKILGKPVVVDNRAGAGGSVGAQYVSKANPDGYTFLMTTMNNAINMSLYSDLDYDLTKDLKPVIELVQSPFILVVNNNVPAKTVAELIAYAKSKPGELNYASSGVGGSSHLAMELLKSATGTDMLHIPLQGSGPSITELLAGRVQVAMLQSAIAMPLIQEGKIRALAVTSAKRSALTPDLPSLAESGVKDFDVAVWYGITIPAKTPQPVVDKLQKAFHDALADPEILTKLKGLGFDIVDAGPGPFGTVIETDVKRWGPIVKASGAKAN